MLCSGIWGIVMKIAFATIAASLALALAGCATPQSGHDTAISLGRGAVAEQEAADLAVADAAMSDMQKSGYRGLKAHLPKLKEALGHAPSSYPAMEQLDNGDYIVRAEDMTDALMLSAFAAAIPGEKKKKRNVVQRSNVYPMIAMMLGSNAVEIRDFAEAHVWLDRGLALQPDNWSLLAEKASAYVGQGKWNEALAIADKALASEDMLLQMHSDAFLRKRGFALVELGRLDEAQKAYEDALKANPDDATSKNELKYIEGLRQGKTPSLGEQISPASEL